MEYQLIKGRREGAILLHILSEKRLYVQKNVQNGIKEYVCYQTILSSEKKKKSSNISVDQRVCFGRVRIHPDGTLEKRVVHRLHDDHSAQILQFQQFNEMKERAQTLRNDFPENVQNVPTRHIFLISL